MISFSPHTSSRTGGPGLRCGALAATTSMAVILAATFLATSPALAGLIEVEIRLPDKGPYAESLVLLHPPYQPGTDLVERMWRRETRRGFTDRQGVIGFVGLPPGRYTVSLPQLTPDILQPSENPAAPAPAVTLFADEEKLRMRVQLQYGKPVGVGVALPYVDPTTIPVSYFVHFRHRATGFERVSELHPQRPRVTRLLSQGTWDVWVAAPPGQLLVGLDHEGTSLPGHAAALELPLPKLPPTPTWLTYAYVTAAAIEGEVVLTGGPPKDVAVVATLVQPGEWLERAEARGGSDYGPVTVPLGLDGHYRLDLPDGIWRVMPQSQRILAVEPEPPLVETKPGEVARADFEVELDPKPLESFQVRVKNPRGEDLVGAVVQLTPLDDPIHVLRYGVTERLDARRRVGVPQRAAAELPDVPEDHYLLLAGHPDYLEAELELFSFRGAEVSEVVIELGAGADLYLQAVDLDDTPARGVEWTIEHLEPPLELKLRDPTFMESKLERVAVTDDSGRVRVSGLYGGTYRLRAVRPPSGEPRVTIREDGGRDGESAGLGGIFHVGRTVGRMAPTVDLYLPEDGSSKAWARQLPSASLLFQLFCDDNGALPPEVSTLVIDLDGPTDDVDAAKEAAVLRADEAALFGRRRDSLLVGPLDQGVYRLAVRPAGFTRWTWAFETPYGSESYPLQIDVEENEPTALLDQGPFKVECGPAVDLVPELRKGEVPDMRRVTVRAQLLDLREDREIAAPPAVERRADRAELRGLPVGPARLDFVLSHPHFLPHTDLRWQVDLESQRGQYVKVAPEIPALGGAVVIERYGTDRGTLVRIEGDGVEPMEAPVETEPVLVPSLVPGTYAVTLCTAAGCPEPLERWESVEVRQGETVVLGRGEPLRH